MRRTLAKVLLALAILPACKSPDLEKKKSDSAVREAPMPEAADQAVSASPTGGTGRAMMPAAPPPADTESYRDYGINGWVDAQQDRLSTFAADVDTASYTIARRKLTEGALPPTSAVRVEEFVNYFRYAYPAPGAGKPFAVHVDAAPSPFGSGRQIVRVGVATRAKSRAERKNANLVFLVDTSGSMQSPDKLELAQRSLRVLVENLKDGDTVSLVTYAGSTSVVLEPTGLDQKGKILAAIEDLAAGGSTAMASGLELAYQQAARMTTPARGDAITRVIVLSDGDANVGNTSHEDMLETIATKVREGITLSTIGFGMGNYKDTTMEQLADQGNGNNFYVDSLSQAKRIFQEQLGSTLEVVAQDVKLQVEFDPRVVARYRLVGYENRDVADRDFRKDAVDAGEIGAGHQVTAIYEIETRANPGASDAPMVTVRVRHKAPKGTKASETAHRFATADIAARFDAASADFRFAFAVAAFADALRGSEDAEHWPLKEIRAIASASAGQDADRAELVALIDRAIALKGGDRQALAE